MQALEIAFTAEPGIAIDLIKQSKQFTNWLASMDRTRFKIRSVHFQSVDMFGPKLGFVKFKADVFDDNNKFIPGIVFMRGGAVAILPVLTCNGEHYAVMTVQPRVPTGQFDFVEIPAGMLDGSGNFGGVAAKELHEELGFAINESELLDLSELAGHKPGCFLSPGGSDETIRLFAYRKEVDESELSSINGRCTGIIEEGEQITLKIMRLEDLWTVADAKTVVAWSLFQKFVLAADSPVADSN